MAIHLIHAYLVGILFVGPSVALLSINNWTYAGIPGTGEEYWSEIPGSSCDGMSQSPIDIVTSSTSAASYKPFSLQSYGIVRDAVLENNGHALEIDLHGETDEGGYYEVTGGGLKGTFRAIQFHFHFGSDESRGSEHTVDGKRYPGEMHIVHYDTAYSSPQEAINAKNGLAVLGFFLEEGTHNSALDVVLDNVPNIEQPIEHHDIHGLQLSDLIPSAPSLDYFWRYEGSLTTPKCNEVVIWTLFKEPIKISKEQLEIMRSLVSGATDENGDPIMMYNNYRSVQEVNGRAVEAVTTTAPTTLPTTTAAAGRALPSLTTLLVTILHKVIFSRP